MCPPTPLEALRVLYGRLRGSARRLLWVAVLTPTILIVTASAAHADNGSNAPASLSWIKIRDSHDIDIWKYELSLDRGGITDSGKAIWSFVTELMWGLYLLGMSVAIWFIDWALSFSWLDVIVAPVVRIGDALTVVVDRFGLAPTLLTITAVAAVLWMAKGKWVLGIFELFLSLIIASLAVGVLANPVALVAGPDGLLYGSRDVGLAISSGLANEGDTSGSAEEVRKDVTGMLADTFIRQPAQIINFGAVLDGGKCEDEYTDVVKDGPYGDGDEIREAVSDCDSDYGEVAENPNSGMAMSAISLFPAALITMLFAAMLSGAVLIAGLYALYNALKLIVTLLAGMLPGPARGALWMTIADLVISLVTLVFSVVFLGAFLMLIRAVFASGNEETRMQTFFIVDALLLAGLVVFWKGRKRLKAAADRLAQSLAKRPGGGAPTSLPQRSTFNPAEIYYKGRMALGAASVAKSALGGASGAPAANSTGASSSSPRRGVASGDQVAEPAPGPASGAGTMTTGAAAFGSAPTPAHAADRPTPAGRVLERVQSTQGRRKAAMGVLLRTGATVAAAAATGGTSAVAQVAGKQLAARAVGATVRRAALTARLRPGQPPAIPPRPAQPGGGRAPGTGRPPGVSGQATRYDRIVADGQVTLVPRTSSRPGRAPAGSQARNHPLATSPTVSKAVSPPTRSRPVDGPPTPTTSGTLPRATPAQPAPIAMPGPSTTSAPENSGADQDAAARRLRARLEGRRTPPALRRRPSETSRPGPSGE